MTNHLIHATPSQMEINHDQWVKDFCQMTHRYVQAELAVSVDGTPESLAFLDHCITQTQKKPVTGQPLNLLGSCIGIYFGKILIEQTQGRWIFPPNVQETNAALETWVECGHVPLLICPGAIALSALSQKEDAPLETMFKIPTNYLAQVELVIERMSPVKTEEYFSLTGRYEFILYLHQILLEIHRQKSE